MEGEIRKKNTKNVREPYAHMRDVRWHIMHCTHTFTRQVKESED